MTETDEATRRHAFDYGIASEMELAFIHDADRLAAIERQVRELADEYQSEPIADELRAIIDPPGQSRDMGDSDDPDVGRYR